jgi:adenosylmethionine-8-amino-7-oxononanoate aminotransferase
MRTAQPATGLRSHLWLPFTQMAAFDSAARTFVRGRGSMLEDATGHVVFDAISSVWTTIHGHGHPAIVAALAAQAAELDHATALGATNPVAERLAARLAQKSGLDVAFFASDGASAVEAALKMAVQFWRQSSAPQRTRFVHLRASYHGDTVGAMSISDIAVFKSSFGAITFEAAAYDDLTEVIERDDVAAVIVEPLVQAAAGLRLVPHERYAPLRARGGGPLVIVDEIATGFGRTGTFFAYEQLGLEPDLVTLGKGITGGALALSATLATQRIYDAFLGERGELRQFFHGHSYAANPIACAAALASLDLFESEATMEHVHHLDAALDGLLAPLAAHHRVREVRRAGLMCGIELDATPEAAWQIADGLYAAGHFTRPIGSTIQLVPPLCARVDELASFCTALLSELER